MEFQIFVPRDTDKMKSGIYQVIETNEDYQNAPTRAQLDNGYWVYFEAPQFFAPTPEYCSVSESFESEILHFGELSTDEIIEQVNGLQPHYMTAETFVKGGQYEIDGETFLHDGFTPPIDALINCVLVDWAYRPISQHQFHKTMVNFMYKI